MKKESGSFTLEGSFIFTWVIFLVIAFLRLDFSLHDWAMKECCEVLARLRIEQMTNYAYDGVNDSFDLNAVIATPLIGEKRVDGTFAKRIQNKSRDYYDVRKLGNKVEDVGNLSEEIRMPKKNAELLRAGTKIIQLIGRDNES